MRRIALLLLAGLAVVVSPTASAKVSATRCVATTTSDYGGGFATFYGNCNGRSTFLTASTGTVLGRVGGLRVSIVGGNTFMAGRIGSRRVSYSVAGSSIFGRYGQYRIFFTLAGSTVFGRVGTARITCFELDASVSTQFNCRGARSGAEVLIPKLAHLYATG
jgi:hypothetical protein